MNIFLLFAFYNIVMEPSFVFCTRATKILVRPCPRAPMGARVHERGRDREICVDGKERVDRDDWNEWMGNDGGGSLSSVSDIFPPSGCSDPSIPIFLLRLA